MPVAFEDKMKRKVQNAAAGMWAESRVLLLRPQEGACVSLQHSVRRRESRPRAKSLDVCVCALAPHLQDTSVRRTVGRPARSSWLRGRKRPRGGVTGRRGDEQEGGKVPQKQSVFVFRDYRGKKGRRLILQDNQQLQSG